jgi:hypothetical protein
MRCDGISNIDGRPNEDIRSDQLDSSSQLQDSPGRRRNHTPAMSGQSASHPYDS